MALKFSYKIKDEKNFAGENSHFIYWTASWDGEVDNDPLWEEAEDLKNPFAMVSDYELDMKIHETNPEHPNPEYSMVNFGEVVAHNPVSLALCECLAASINEPEKFSKMTGSTVPYWYRSQLIKFLTELWD